MSPVTCPLPIGKRAVSLLLKGLLVYDIIEQNYLSSYNVFGSFSIQELFTTHDEVKCTKFIFQSFIDCCVSMVLLLTTLTVMNIYVIRNTGLLGELECRLWNSKQLLWSLFLCSTWNLVSMTFER